MSTRILRNSAAAAAFLSMVVVSGCGSGSSPLEVLPDTDQSTGEADTSGTDGSEGIATDTGSDTDDSDAGETNAVGTDAGGADSSEETAADTGSDTDDTTGETEDETDTGDVDADTGGDVPVVTAFAATYRATFVATWSVDTHPINFPGNPHFSPLTGAVHSEQSIFWEMGQNATDGIEEMAETGAISILLTEVQSVIDEGRALAAIQGGGVAVSPGSTSVEFTVNRDYSLVTLVSMLAPSPDWFVGVNSLQMIDENGAFRPLITIDLNLYDSGTDGGTRYTSADADIPRSPIDLVNSFPLDSDFQGGQPSVGQLTLELIQ